MSESTQSELVVVEPDASAAIVAADPQSVVDAFANYQQIQSALDKAMPDCIMDIQGKKFRKKQYWRAIATAFNLKLSLQSERREVIENGDWGYLVEYRATASNGRTCDGDGACFASEKTDRNGKPTAMQTEHNVRAHAHTRAKNRAIADLVGFGEVSAEEVTKDERSLRSTRATLTSVQRKTLATAVVKKSERLLDHAADEQIKGAPQDDESMQFALKKATAARLNIATCGRDDVDAFLATIDLAVLNGDGTIQFFEVA